ncbi:transferase, partial [Streptomyces bauhiniae]|nr:transferase [Streptomyces bauhiniae]
MTAESIVPSPSASGRESGYAVRPARGFRFPVRRPHSPTVSPLPLLTADLAAAVAGVVVLDAAVRGPLVVAALVGTALLLRPRPACAVTGVLDELPSVCGRIAVVWLALGALTAAL